jgi:hypothetical protein
MPNCGSTSTSTGTWSGLISKAMISARYFLAVRLITCSQRFASDQPARCADTRVSTRNDICWNTPHYCSICTLLVPCLNRRLSNTSEIGFASQNTPYIPSPKGRGLYRAFSVKKKTLGVAGSFAMPKWASLRQYYLGIFQSHRESRHLERMLAIGFIDRHFKSVIPRAAGTPKSHVGGLAADWFTGHMYQPRQAGPSTRQWTASQIS